MYEDDIELGDAGLTNEQEKHPSESEKVELSAKKPVGHYSRAQFIIDRDVYGILCEQFPEESYDDRIVHSDYTAEFLHSDEGHAVELTTSNSDLGPENSSEPYQSYDLKIREFLPDGTVAGSTPLISFSLQVIPQYEGAVYKSKDEDEDSDRQDEYPNLYGAGRAKIDVKTKAVESEFDFELRALDLLNTVLDGIPEFTQDEVIDEGRRLFTLEFTHRIKKQRFGDILGSLQKSKRVLPGAATHDNTSAGCIRESFCSNDWDMLGFDSSYPIKLKGYYPASGSSAPGVMHHPRVEATLHAPEPHPHLSEFDEIAETVQSVLLSHMRWAGVDDEDIVEGQLYPEDVHDTTYLYPTNRRWLLRNHFLREEILHEIIAECKKSTKSIYDLLQAIINCHHEGFTATYSDLAERIGRAKRTVRYHVRRLDEKGILNRRRTSVTLIEFVSGDLREWTEKRLQKLEAGDLAKDRQERIKERKSPDEDDEGGSEDSTNEAQGPASGATDPTAPDEQTAKNSADTSWVEPSALGRTIPPPR